MVSKGSQTGRVVVFFGLTGSGKSYLATAFAMRCGYPYLNSDRIRKELSGIAIDAPSRHGLDEGIYHPEMTERVYEELFRRGSTLLGQRGTHTVVLDGSFQDRKKRVGVKNYFSPVYDIYYVYCHCSESVSRERLSLREADPNAVSDGNWEVYLLQESRFEPPDEIVPSRLLRLDTDGALEYLMARVASFLQCSAA